MSTRNRLTSSRPAVPARPGQIRRLTARLWANRPSLGALACLLAVPGVANVAFGWPLWWTAAGQWSLWALLLVAVSVIEARRPAPAPSADGQDDYRPAGHDVPPHFGVGTAPGQGDGR